MYAVGWPPKRGVDITSYYSTWITSGSYADRSVGHAVGQWVNRCDPLSTLKYQALSKMCYDIAIAQYSYLNSGFPNQFHIAIASKLLAS